MTKRILFPVIICVFVLFSFKSDTLSEALGKDFVKFLREYSTSSNTKLKSLFITKEAMQTFPEIEIPGFSLENLDKFIDGELQKIDAVARDYGIVWDMIEYEKTESQIVYEKEIEVYVLYVKFSYNTIPFATKLVALKYKKKLHLVRIMQIIPEEE